MVVVFHALGVHSHSALLADELGAAFTQPEIVIVEVVELLVVVVVVPADRIPRHVLRPVFHAITPHGITTWSSENQRGPRFDPVNTMHLQITNYKN